MEFALKNLLFSKEILNFAEDMKFPKNKLKIC